MDIALVLHMLVGKGSTGSPNRWCFALCRYRALLRSQHYTSKQRLSRDPQTILKSLKNTERSGAQQMQSPSLLISWVNPFPSRFINRTIFFCNALESHECACCLLSFLYFHWLFLLYQRVKLPQGIVLFRNPLGKGLTPRDCMVDAGSIWWVSGTLEWGTFTAEQLLLCPSVVNVCETANVALHLSKANANT